MITRIRNYALCALGIGIFYFLITHHIAFTSFYDFSLLKKTEPTLRYTFLSITQLNPNRILRVEALRDAGLGELLVERGILREERFEQILDRIDAEEAAKEEAEE